MMKRLLLAALIPALTLGGCTTIAGLFGRSEKASASAAPAPSLERIADGVWIHKSYQVDRPHGPILSQGLVVDTGEGVVLVDTAWTNADTERLLQLIEQATGANPEIAVLTHAHNDKMGGVQALREARVAARAHPLTNEDAPARGLIPAPMTILGGRDHDSLLGSSPVGRDDDGPVEVFYPGPGHTRDNIVVYYAPAKVLFGGCLIRPGDAKDLGNVADADIANWASAVRAVAARFPNAQIIIPSHGARGGHELLEHTIALAEAAANGQR